jgi:hypothetical protein
MASERAKPIARRNVEEERILNHAEMSDAQLDAILVVRYQASLAALREMRVCVYCNMQYREIDNLGAWECAYHPGTLCQPEGVMGRRYKCCGQAFGRPPCRSCDHTMGERVYEKYLGNVFVAVPRYAINSEEMRGVEIPADAVLRCEPHSGWIAQEFRVRADIGDVNGALEAAYEDIVARSSVLVHRVDVRDVRLHANIAALPFFQPSHRAEI